VGRIHKQNEKRFIRVLLKTGFSLDKIAALLSYEVATANEKGGGWGNSSLSMETVGTKTRLKLFSFCLCIRPCEVYHCHILKFEETQHQILFNLKRHLGFFLGSNINVINS